MKIKLLIITCLCCTGFLTGCASCDSCGGCSTPSCGYYDYNSKCGLPSCTDNNYYDHYYSNPCPGPYSCDVDP